MLSVTRSHCLERATPHPRKPKHRNLHSEAGGITCNKRYDLSEPMPGLHLDPLEESASPIQGPQAPGTVEANNMWQAGNVDVATRHSWNGFSSLGLFRLTSTFFPTQR